ncbi:MAG: sigma-70 family RNA polymerase sigma factor [Acidimicrobiales bacterium]
MNERHEFSAVYAENYRRLLSVARSRVDTAADAEDIVQQSFGALWCRWDSIARPEGYLWTSVMNGCRDEVRRAQQRRRYEHLFVEPPAAERDYLVDVLARLPAGRRTAVVRRYYGGNSMAEIAAATGQPVGTVKSSLHRGLRDLRRLLDA